MPKMKRRDIETNDLTIDVVVATNAWAAAKAALSVAERSLERAQSKLAMHTTMCEKVPTFMNEDVEV